MSVELRLCLPPQVASVAAARAALAGVSDHVPSAVCEDLRLLVSELVTNSLIHAGLGPDDAVTLLVTADGGAVRAEVHDPGPGFEPPTGPPRPNMMHGRGLYLVSRLARRWGVRRGRDATCVWFELDLARSVGALEGSPQPAERSR